GFQIADVALHAGLADVRERAGAHAVIGRIADGRLGCLKPAAAVCKRTREGTPVACRYIAQRRIRLARRRALLHPGDAVTDVAREAPCPALLAVLAVVDDVDAQRGLLANDLPHVTRQTRFESRTPRRTGVNERGQRLRSRERPRVRNE